MSEMFSIALSGMRDSVLRISNAVRNIVNASSTGRLPSAPGEKATSFQAKDVVTMSMAGGGEDFGVYSLLKDREPGYIPMQNPSSPFANEEGLIAAPNVDLATELLNAKMAARTYYASAKLIKVAEENDRELMNTVT